MKKTMQTKDEPAVMRVDEGRMGRGEPVYKVAGVLIPTKGALPGRYPLPAAELASEEDLEAVLELMGWLAAQEARHHQWHRRCRKYRADKEAETLAKAIEGNRPEEEIQHAVEALFSEELSRNHGIEATHRLRQAVFGACNEKLTASRSLLERFTDSLAAELEGVLEVEVKDEVTLCNAVGCPHRPSLAVKVLARQLYELTSVPLAAVGVDPHSLEPAPGATRNQRRPFFHLRRAYENAGVQWPEGRNEGMTLIKRGGA